ncbi:MAG TPA: palindromic element RPE4 domain-containing protein [Rickettsia endosymbiont of Pyrocoelia pectoralis]|nr:palindromic element RPE4 domain-containing protein [Rickettsia endosymbiont of Pyrocoelia pectoralis]
MIYSRDPVKNIKIIDILNYFLDTVVKPRYDKLDLIYLVSLVIQPPPSTRLPS